jgi:hypothetical protein
VRVARVRARQDWRRRRRKSADLVVSSTRMPAGTMIMSHGAQHRRQRRGITPRAEPGPWERRSRSQSSQPCLEFLLQSAGPRTAEPRRAAGGLAYGPNSCKRFQSIGARMGESSCTDSSIRSYSSHLPRTRDRGRGDGASRREAAESFEISVSSAIMGSRPGGIKSVGAAACSLPSYSPIRAGTRCSRMYQLLQSCGLCFNMNGIHI